MRDILPIIMVFCHIVDDYYLQGVLANLKQKKWWKDNAPQELYENDYIVALIMHSFSWAFMIMLPIMIYTMANNCFSVWFYVIALVINTIIHTFVDNLKANARKINLATDQGIHMIQISLTCLIFYTIY